LDINKQKIDELVENNKVILKNSKFFEIDISNGYAVKEFFKSYEKKYKDLDVLINNAAANGKYEDFLDIGIETWDRVINVNLNSFFYCA